MTWSKLALGSCLWKQYGGMTGDDETGGRETGEETRVVIQEASDESGRKIVM